MRQTRGFLAVLFCSGLMLTGCSRDTQAPEVGDLGEPVTDTGDVSDTSGGDISDPPLVFSPADAVLARLTSQQYINTVEDIFGIRLNDIVLEADTNPYLFYSVGATTTEVSENGVELYAEAAYALTDYLFNDVSRREGLLGCVPTTANDNCIQSFIVSYGRRLYRRSLTSSEVQRWLTLSAELGTENALDGAKLVLAGMLQSPHFLYRVELGEEDPQSQGQKRYSSVEMASRLSFLLWNSTPDDILLNAAERGDLIDPVKLRQETMRMLSAPKSRVAIQDFFSQYLDLGRLEEVERDPLLYPGYNPSLPTAMETEVRLLVDDIVFRNKGDIRDLFTEPRGYVNRALAELYGVEAPGASEVAFVPVDFPSESKRAGILTLGAFLTMNAHPTETSPTLRGKYIRERVLCQAVPAPPDDIDLNLEAEPGEEPATLRERLEEHRNNPSCYGCHAYIDPPGFLFENFDSVGAFRTEENGHPIDASGDLDGIPLADATDLAVQLAHDPRLAACMVKQLYRHATGRLDEPGEAASLQAIGEAFAQNMYRFDSLLVELIQSEGFRQVAMNAGQEVSP